MFSHKNKNSDSTLTAVNQEKLCGNNIVRVCYPSPFSEYITSGGHSHKLKVTLYDFGMLYFDEKLLSVFFIQ